MYGLTGGRNTVKVNNDGRLMILNVAAKEVINQGILVALNADGFAISAKKAEGLTAVGRANTYADNTKGANGDLIVEVERGTFIWENDSTAADKVTQAHLMKPCYIKDNVTVTTLATGSSFAGKVVAVYEDGGIAVETL